MIQLENNVFKHLLSKVLYIRRYPK